MKLNGVVHVPSFRHNLLSGIQVMKQGYKQVIADNRLEIIGPDNEVVATGTYNQDHGLIQMDSQIKPIAQVCTLNEWHRKLGHLGESNLRRTLDKHQVPYSGKLDDCEECLKGKMKKLPVSK